MKKWILLFLVSGFANTASAAIDDIAVCNQLKIQFPRDRDACYRSLRGVEYVQKGAINVCKKVQFSRDKVTCIVNAVNKTYLASELKFCASEPFSRDKAKCMKRRGEAVDVSHPVPSHGKLKRRLRRVKRSIREGEYRRALRILNRILDDL